MSHHSTWIERVGCIVVASASALMLAEGAQGDLIGTTIDISPEQHPEQGVVTLRVYLVFDSGFDQLLAITGDAQVSLLLFETDGEPLRQNCDGQPIDGGEQCVCDCRSPGDLGGDTWVNIGERMGECLVFMEGGCKRCCIVGSSWGGKDSGYIDRNPGTRELPDENGRILIAQFSLPDDTCFSYQGTASFNLEGGELTKRAFLLEHCVCLGDLDVSGAVDFDDLLQVLTNWGPQESCPPHSPADLDKDCNVGFSDLLILLSTWGPCE